MPVQTKVVLALSGSMSKEALRLMSRTLGQDFAYVLNSLFIKLESFWIQISLLSNYASITSYKFNKYAK